MTRARTEVRDAFWEGDLGFVCNSRIADADLPDSTSLHWPDYAPRLLAGGRLPDLQGAPVASWVLARCALLCGTRFPYGYDAVSGSDGGNFWLSFICFTRDFKPVGTLAVAGGELDLGLYVTSRAPHAPHLLAEAFTAHLLGKPLDLKKCLLTVVYTDLADPEFFKKNIPYTFGWTRDRFVGRPAPEHAIDPHEYD
jgi:hypothetical protein